MLSTRRDLLPAGHRRRAREAAGPRAAVSHRAGARRRSTRLYGKPVDAVFRSFDRTPIASASVAQVHFAELPDGTPVAVKVLRPNIAQVIEKDISLLQAGATLLEKLWSDGKRLRPRAVVAEFERTLRDELDLSREAANCSQLRRNFQHSPLLLVPAVHWDYCGTDVMVMERMTGIPIAQVDRLREAGIDIPRLARAGVELFFTQVFRDAYFHADMHPGNIFVATDPPHHGKYIAVDFGIMGTLSERDQGYLAQNFLAFFRRDYHRVATAHLESGWVPPDTRVDELEAEIRVVLEPAFDRPLSEISLGRVLLQLFRASRRFNVEIQPQLVLLQKTLLNVEGLGRQLDPNLDLWVTALALSRALDERPDRPACAEAAAARRGAVHRRRVARAAAAHPPAPDGAGDRRRRRDQGTRRGAARTQRAPGRHSFPADGSGGPAALANSVRLER